MRRADIERAILEEEDALLELARLLVAKAAVEDWPEPLRAGLRLALDESGLVRSETWKVVALSRHLFGSSAMVPPGLASAVTSVADQRLAERVRADLPALVPLRAGSYLIIR